MINILVTGANGQLGMSLRAISSLYTSFEFLFTDIDELDLTSELKVRQFFNDYNVGYIINCAAFTDVDGAEEQSPKAFLLNEEVPGLLGKICTEKSIYLIHLSTDFIFNGESKLPYKESDQPDPRSVYGKSKLAGEELLKNNEMTMIIRTSWLYGEYGRNFMKTMLTLSRERNEFRVVNDQFGTPTYSDDLAKAILHIINYSEDYGFKHGIFHYSNEGFCSWFEFAKEIFFKAGINCMVKPVTTSGYPLPAKRPAYSILDKSKIKNTFGLNVPHWKESLNVALSNVKKNREI